MPVPPGGIYRILQGETIAVDLWSNVAVHVGGSYQLLYDDGSTDRIVIDDFTTGSSRARQTADANDIASHDGWVISGDFGLVGPSVLTAVQRGQLYAFARITKDPDQPMLGKRLSSGYVWTGSSIPIGVYVEPGPAGGHGAITRRTLTGVTPVSTGLILGATPAGALWRWISGSATYTATGTVGTRVVRLRWRDASGNVWGPRAIASQPTAGQISVMHFAENYSSPLATAVDPGSTGGTTETPSPRGALPAAYDLFVVDGAAIDIADSCGVEAQVEEWVVPN
jgi:hypothetical protein